MKIKEFLSKYGFLIALAGLVPMRSGILLLQEKDCGCFLIDKATLYAHNIFFGSLSLAVGFGLIALGFWQKELKASKGWVIIFLLAGGIAGYSTGAVEKVQPEIAGEHDELAKKLTSEGWVLFYANWCSACHRQIEMLGTSVKYLRMIDCATIPCPDFVESYPTWVKVSHGSVVEVKGGIQKIETLKEMAKLK